MNFGRSSWLPEYDLILGVADGFRLLVVGVDQNDGATEVWGDLPSSTSAARLADLLARFAPSVERTRGFPKPTRTEAEQTLRGWFKRDSGPMDNTLLYWVGHGAWGDSEFYLVTADSEAELDDWTSMSSGALAKFLKLDWDRRKPQGDDAPWTVAVLDCCSGSLAVEHMIRQFDVVDVPHGLGLVGGNDATFAGSFVDALEEVLEAYDFNDREVRVRGLFEELAVQTHGRIHADVSRLAPSAVLINQLAGTAALVVNQAATATLRSILAGLTPDERDHFVAKAQGAELDDMAWHFQGRTHASRQIAAWVDSDSAGMLVVTGRAGCGKSAVLGRLVTMTDPAVVSALVNAGVVGETPPADEIPARRIDAAVHLTGKSFADVVGQIAAAVPGFTGSTHDFGAVLHAIEARTEFLVIVADALDEAQDPLGIAASLLRRLASTGRVKLLVGTRRSLREGVDQSDPIEHELIDALAPRPDDVLVLVDEPQALERYSYGRLTAAGSPLAHDPRRAEVMARRIAMSGQPFLFARLAVVEIVARPDRTDDELEHLLSGGHRRLFQVGLGRLAMVSDAAVPLLRALAYGLGRGLPRRDNVWLSVARALHPSTAIDDTDVNQVLALAAPHIAHDGEAGQGTYRLAHRTYVEHFEAEGLLVERHRAVADALISIGDAVGWVNANAYLALCTAAHARIGDRLDRVLADVDLLDHHDQSRLAAELQSRYFGSGDLDPVAGAVLRVRDELVRATPRERPALRRLARFLNGQPALDDAGPDASVAWWPRWGRSDSPIHLRLAGHTSQVNSVAFGTLPDGQVVLASAAFVHDNTVRLWDPATGLPLGSPLLGHTGSVNSVAFGLLDTGRLVLASASDDRTVRLWDPATGQVVGLPMTHPSSVMAVAMAVRDDGQPVLATANADGTVRLWDPGTGLPLRRPLQGHTDVVTSVAFGALADGRVGLASASRDDTVRLWDPATGEQLGPSLTGYGRSPAYVAFGMLADHRAVLAVASNTWRDTTTYVVDLTTGASIGQPVQGHSYYPNPLAFGTLADGRVVLVTTDHGDVRLWEPATGKPIGSPITGHTKPVLSTALGTLSDGRVLLATGSQDATVRLWDPALRWSAIGPIGAVSSLVLGSLANGKRALATTDTGGTVRLWEMETGRPIGKAIDAHADELTFGTLDDGRVVLACICTDGSAAGGWTPRLWDTATGEQIDAAPGRRTGKAALLARPDGHLVLVHATADRTVELSDPFTGRLLAPPLPGQTAWSALGPRGNGQLTIVNADGADKPLQMWDLLTGEPVGSPVVGAGTVRRTVLGVVGDRQTILATTGDDAAVRLWNPFTGQVVGPALVGHVAVVNAVAFITLADGLVVVATASDDTTVRLWNLATGQILGGAAFPERARSVMLAHSNRPGWVVAAVRFDSSIAVVDFLVGGTRA